jgi:hypothetical protein
MQKLKIPMAPKARTAFQGIFSLLRRRKSPAIRTGTRIPSGRTRHARALTIPAAM